MPSPENFVQDQIPRTSWHTVPTVLKTAYMAVDQLIKDTHFLHIESAQDNKGRLISYATDYFMAQAIENGAIDCDFRWKNYAKPTGRFLEMRFTHSTASISQVSNPRKQPRNVVFRENAKFSNQAAFAFPEIQEEQEITGLPHFLIVHGHQLLNFAHFGIPSASSKTEYSWLSPNLMKLPHATISDGPAPEDTDFNFDQLNLLKEDIDKLRNDYGEI